MPDISNSRINSYLICPTLHDFQYHQKLKAKRIGSALYRGIKGHEALDALYRTIMEGGTYELAEKAALDVLQKEMVRVTVEDELDRLEILVGLKGLIKRYVWEVAEPERLNPIIIEDLMSVTVNEELDLNYVWKGDLLAEITKGPDRGSLIALDHKFKYDFFTVDQLQNDGQLPRYYEGFKKLGYSVIRAEYNVLRHRVLKNPTTETTFRRQPVDLPRKYRQSVWDTTVELMLEIVTSPRRPLPILNGYQCAKCDFLLPCKRQLAGEDITTILRANFEPRTSPLEGEIENDSSA